MKFLKVLDAMVSIVWILLIILLVFSFYNMIIPFVSIITQGEEAFKADVFSDDTTNTTTTVFSLSINNLGLIDNKMTISLKLLSSDERVLTSGKDTKIISPGSTEKLTVSLLISKEILEDPSLQPHFLLSIESRTLFNLVGFGFSTKI